MVTDNDIRYKQLLSHPSEWMGCEKLAKLHNQIEEIGIKMMYETYLKYEIELEKKWDAKVAEFLKVYDENYKA